MYSLLFIGEFGSNLNVIAKLGFNLLNLLRNILLRNSQKIFSSSLSETRCTKVVNNNFSIG